jgi:hypothetical protein
MNELEKLFGSHEKVKIIRMFLSHSDTLLQVEDIVKNTKLRSDKIRKELNTLVAANLIIKSKERIAKLPTSGKVKKMVIKEYICYKLNKDFRFINSLSGLMFDFKNANRDALYDRFKSVGRTKLFLVSGVFTGTEKARVDIMYVGENVKKSAADKTLSDLRAELGMDLNIIILDLEEFNYRYKMFDRFVRDTLTGEHVKLVNKLNL